MNVHGSMCNRLVPVEESLGGGDILPRQKSVWNVSQNVRALQNGYCDPGEIPIEFTGWGGQHFLWRKKKSQQKNRAAYYNKSSKNIGTLLGLCSLGEHQMRKQSLMFFCCCGVHVCRVDLFVILRCQSAWWEFGNLSVCVCVFCVYSEY